MFNERSDMIVLKDDLWLKRQKVAGKTVSECLKTFANFVRTEKGMSFKDIEALCVDIIKNNNCTPTFLGYDGFPGAVCISVNENMVHGIPTDYVLQDGDIVSLDLGATFEGAIADAAFTCIHGTPKSQKHVDMLKACQDALNAGVDAVEAGKRLGVIGSAIHRSSREKGFALVDDYGGHGIDYNKPHANPFVSNKSHGNEGPRMQKGLSIAIEPMLILGPSSKTFVLDDKWTVASKEVNCHFEHSVSIDLNGSVYIVTQHDMDVLDYV